MIPSLLSISLICGCIPSMDCMIPSLLSISLICGCIPSMAFIFLATSTSGMQPQINDMERRLHIVDLWLHTLDGLHLSGDLNEWLSVIESLEDSSGKGFLDVLDGSGLGNSGVTVTS